MKRVALLILMTLFAAPSMAQRRWVRVPLSPVVEATDHYHGEVIVDPYRWMEKHENFSEWLSAQDVYSRSMLRHILGGNELVRRIAELDNAVDTVTSLQRTAGDTYFYFRTEAGGGSRKLLMRKGLRGRERILVDPDKVGEEGSFLGFFVPSLDGRYVSFGLTKRTSAESVLRVVETASGRILPDQIDRTHFISPAWLPDGKSFLYWRASKLPEGAPWSESLKRTRVYLHVLEQDPEMDRPIFGYGLAPEISEDHFNFVAYVPGSSYLVAFGRHGVDKNLLLFRAPLSALSRDSMVWERIAGPEDEVTRFAVHGNDIYLLTHKDAPTRKVVRTSLAKPDLAKAPTIVDQSSSVITGIDAARDALYVQKLEDGIERMHRVPFGRRKAAPIRLPFAGSIASVDIDPRFDGAFLYLTSWTESPRWYRYLPWRKVRDTRLQPKSTVDFSGYETTVIKVESADGTLVPMSILAPKGLRKDGSHPTLLWAFGAYGLAVTPSFDPKHLAWLEWQGVLAFAHVRGGGEYGEEWHRGGQKQNKMNSIADFIACAESLIVNGFTSPARLSAMAEGAGGTVIGRAMVARPELFAAVAARDGIFNPLRLEFTPLGSANVPEFGSVSIRDEFEALRSIDPFVNAAEKKKYPSVLLTAGLDDSRLPIWQSAKMVARLQTTSTSGKHVILRVRPSSTRSQLQEELADIYIFLLWQLLEQPIVTTANGK